MSPDQRNEIERRSCGAVRKRPIGRLAEHGRGEILKADAVEDILARRQVFDQRLGGEIGFRQRVDEDRALNVAEAVGRCDLDQHARRPVGARPDYAGIDGHIA